MRVIAAFLLTAFLFTIPATAEPQLIRFYGGVMCDTADQVETIVSQHGTKNLREVVVELNAGTGRVSCGAVNRPLLLFMEPHKIVRFGSKRFLIVKLTAMRGFVQYAWRPIEDMGDGQET